MTMTNEQPRTAASLTTITRERRLGAGPDENAQARHDQEVKAIRARRDAQQISANTYQRQLRDAADRLQKALVDTRVTYTFTSVDLGPWTVTASTGDVIPGEFPSYPRAVAAAREHHSFTRGAGRARAGQYIRLDVAANRATGSRVQALDLAAEDSEYEPEPGKRWATRCVDHGTVVLRKGYQEARDEASRPQDWCPPCKDKASAEAQEVKAK